MSVLLNDILGSRLMVSQSLLFQAAIEAYGSANATVDILFATYRTVFFLLLVLLADISFNIILFLKT